MVLKEFDTIITLFCYSHKRRINEKNREKLDAQWQNTFTVTARFVSITWERKGLLWKPYLTVTQHCHSTNGPGDVGSCSSTSIFTSHLASKSSHPPLQTQTLTGGWCTWRAAERPDAMIKNACWCGRECLHDATITHWGEKRFLSPDASLIGGLLIMMSEQSVFRDRLVPTDDFQDWCFLYEARFPLLVSSAGGKRQSVPDDKWELVEMWSLKYWIPVDLHKVYDGANRKCASLSNFSMCEIWGEEGFHAWEIQMAVCERRSHTSEKNLKMWCNADWWLRWI